MSKRKTDPPAIKASGSSRREFLGRFGGWTAAGVAAGMAGFPALTDSSVVLAEATAPDGPNARRNRAFQVRLQAALDHRRKPLVEHENNGDDDRYDKRIASFTKGLPHNQRGEVDTDAYEELLDALWEGDHDDFDDIPMGIPNPSQRRRLVNPQAGLAFDMEGTDSQALTLPPAPAFDSAEEAGEMVENYWMALTRDVPFQDYDRHPLTRAAAIDLLRLSDFRGPKRFGTVTPATLFRGNTPGDLVGPYISQFLTRPFVPFGANFIDQRMRTTAPGVDYMTRYPDWLQIQRGFLPDAPAYDNTRRLIRNGRDLGEWVHVDVLFQAYFHALLQLLAAIDPSDPTGSGLGAPFDEGNPYLSSETQEGFGTFGPPHIAALMCEVATRALKAVWFQKWQVHRRLRPEAFAGRIHNHMTRAGRYPFHSDVLNSQALVETFSRYRTYLLPMAYPEGSPMHPAYGAGHATVAGACVTILKAWFDESYVIPNPLVPTRDGLSIEPYTGPDAHLLTVGGELNKLASNIAIGRNIAGVHWRTDATASLRLGEEVAISVLQDHGHTYNEDFDGFSLTRFDGTRITV